VANHTNTEVVNWALEIINRKALGEDADADTFARANAVYLSLHEDLRRTYEERFKANRLSWSYDAVPDAYYADVVGILAGQLTLFLPCSAEATARGTAARQQAEIAIANKFQRLPVSDTSRFDEMLSPIYNKEEWSGR